MNKIKRMENFFHQEKTDCIPVGFWCHFPDEYTVEQHIQAHVDFYHQTDMDIVKIMDDSWNYLVTADLNIQKASDWRHIHLPGRDCRHYQAMETIMRGVLERVGDDVMVFPTLWSPFKMGSFACRHGDAEFMEHCRQDPQAVLQGVSAIADMLCSWTCGYLDTGVHGIYYSAQFSEPTRFDQDEWERLVKPSDTMLLSLIMNAGKYSIVHICGEEEHKFVSSPEHYTDYPASAFNWDCHRASLTLAEGKKLFGAPVIGGVDNHGAFVSGTNEQASEAVDATLQAISGQVGFMLGADCTIPFETPRERIAEAVAAARRFSEGARNE
ncbi:MAG: uroporphyrinogen decarboxylase family protein [Clostridia bacterium]